MKTAIFNFAVLRASACVFVYLSKQRAPVTAAREKLREKSSLRIKANVLQLFCLALRKKRLIWRVDV